MSDANATMGERAPDSAGRTENGREATNSAPPGGVLSAREVAARLGVSERTVRRAIARGDLAASKHAGRYRIPFAALSRLPPQLAGTSPSPGPRGASRRIPAAFSRGLAALPTARLAPLPLPLTPFVGRERDVAAVATLLDDPTVRLVTLTGPGGTGKARLSLTVAADVREHHHGRFADGVAFVDLAPIASPILATAAMGVRESDGDPVETRLRAFVGVRGVLIILDNFEHVIAAPPLVAALLSAGPSLTVLATSRAPLHVAGEREFPVPPLTLPVGAGRRWAGWRHPRRGACSSSVPRRPTPTRADRSHRGGHRRTLCPPRRPAIGDRTGHRRCSWRGSGVGCRC